MSVDEQIDNSEEDDSSGQSVEAILGTLTTNFEPSEKREFQPWHRPRKQYVRRKQWLEELSNLLDRLPEKPEPLTYLTLPGDDLLDLRYLHESLCKQRALLMRFVGFNTSALGQSKGSPQFEVNLHAVRRLQYIDEGSDVLYDRLQDIGRQRSVSRRRIIEHGSFHAINLDLCDNLAKEGAIGNDVNLFGALSVLLEVQSRSRNESLLFVTSRMNSEQTAEDVKSVFQESIDKNLKECESFALGVSRCWFSGDIDSNIKNVSAMGHEDLFLLGFSKWIVANAFVNRLSAELTSVLTYRVLPSASVDDMMSAVIKLRPLSIPSADPSGLARVGLVAGTSETECGMASKLPGRIKYRKSVDQKLSEDQELWETCVSESEELLQQAGFDPAEYRRWLENDHAAHQ